MEKFLVIFYKLIGSIYIPHFLKHREEPILLHISDTPSIFLSVLNRFIKRLNPEYIIHTGDLVDNIKLELFPRSIDRYRMYLKKLLRDLNNSKAKEIYVSLGNHDDLDSVSEYCGRINIIEEFEKVEIEGLEFGISHYSSILEKNPSEFNLFGHNLDIGNETIGGKWYLNGIKGINIVMLKSRKIVILPYPLGIDEHRLKRGKMKI